MEEANPNQSKDCLAHLTLEYSGSQIWRESDRIIWTKLLGMNSVWFAIISEATYFQ